MTTTYLVLEQFVSPFTNIPAGQLITSDSYPNLSDLEDAGLTVIQYDAPSMAATLARFLAQYPDNPSASLLSMLTADGVVTPGGGVPSSRTVTGTAPITINGSTSATLAGNITIAIVAATDSVPGSMSAADKTKLDGIAASAVALAASGVPVAPGTAARGSGTTAAAIDHVHPAGVTAAKAFADTPYTAPANLGTLELDTSGGIVVVNLPTLANAQGQRLLIVDATASFATHKATVTPAGSEKINGGTGGASLDLSTASERIYFVAGVTSWWTIKSA